MFTDRYRAAYASLGMPLKPSDGMGAQDLDVQSLEGIHLPDALREYYLVAGNEKRLNHSFNRLLAPKDMFVEANRIVFMEENQNVVYWGIPAQSDTNPTVEQGVNLENQSLEWHTEDTTCAEFLETTLYWQASFGGGLKYCTSALVSPAIKTQLEQDFRFVGKIGGLETYARDGCALSFLKWFEDEWRLFAGFKTRKMQLAIGRELRVHWEEY